MSSSLAGARSAVTMETYLGMVKKKKVESCKLSLHNGLQGGGVDHAEGGILRALGSWQSYSNHVELSVLSLH